MEKEMGLDLYSTNHAESPGTDGSPDNRTFSKTRKTPCPVSLGLRFALWTALGAFAGAQDLLGWQAG